MERVFEVVEDGQRLMTSEDLEFVDEDIDTRYVDQIQDHFSFPKLDCKSNIHAFKFQA